MTLYWIKAYGSCSSDGCIRSKLPGHAYCRKHMKELGWTDEELRLSPFQLGVLTHMGSGWELHYDEYAGSPSSWLVWQRPFQVRTVYWTTFERLKEDGWVVKSNQASPKKFSTEEIWTLAAKSARFKQAMT